MNEILTIYDASHEIWPTHHHKVVKRARVSRWKSEVGSKTPRCLSSAGSREVVGVCGLLWPVAGLLDSAASCQRAKGGAYRLDSSVSAVLGTQYAMSWFASIIHAATLWLTSRAPAKAVDGSLKLRPADEKNVDFPPLQGNLSPGAATPDELLTRQARAKVVSADATRGQADPSPNNPWPRPEKIFSTLASPSELAGQESSKCEENHLKRVTRKRSLNVVYRDISDEDDDDSGDEQSTYDSNNEESHDPDVALSSDPSKYSEVSNPHDPSTSRSNIGCQTKHIRLYPLQREIEVAE
jgi:hypothetical protein